MFSNKCIVMSLLEDNNKTQKLDMHMQDKHLL